MSERLEVDVAVFGGGFGGSLTALLLRKIGLTCAVIERGRHPRFALGESSTPQADLILDRLATIYDLPRIQPLAAWGPWQRTYPELPCGLKRGFSYFHHRPGEPFVPHPDHRTELLVASSVGDEDADTHWHRATFDQFLFQLFEAGTISYDEAIRNADSQNEVRLDIKLKSKRAKQNLMEDEAVKKMQMKEEEKGLMGGRR